MNFKDIEKNEQHFVIPSHSVNRIYFFLSPITGIERIFTTVMVLLTQANKIA